MNYGVDNRVDHEADCTADSGVMRGKEMNTVNKMNTVSNRLENRWITWMCFAVIGFLGTYLAVFQRALDRFAIDYSLNKVLMGSVVTLHFAGLLVGPLIAGELSDKFGRKIVILCAMLAFFIGLVLVTISSGAWLLLIGILAIGAGFGVLEGSMTTLLTDITPGNPNRIINMSQIFFSIGTTVGPFIAMAALLKTQKWKWIYALCGVFVLFFLFAFKKLPYPDCKAAEKLDGIITIQLLKNRTFLLLCLSMLMYVGIEEGLAFWITTYVKEINGSEFFPSLVLSIFWGSMIIGRYAASRFSKHLNELIIAGISISSVFLIVSILSGSLAMNMIAFFFIGLGLSGVWPIIMAITKSFFPGYTGTAFGIMMSCCALGGILVPFIMGYISELASMKWALAFCLIPGLVIIICQLVIRRRAASRPEA